MPCGRNLEYRGATATKGHSAAFRRDCRPGLVEGAFGARACTEGKRFFSLFRRDNEGYVGGTWRRRVNARGKLGFDQCLIFLFCNGFSPKQSIAAFCRRVLLYLIDLCLFVLFFILSSIAGYEKSTASGQD